MSAAKPLTPVQLPPALKPRGTIGIIAPGRTPPQEWVAHGKGILEKHGFQVVVHAQTYLHAGQLAGNDAARAEGVMDMFSDRTIDAIISARGGAGSMRIIDRLDYKLIKKNPKPFIGFSDITALLSAITRHSGFATFHGPMMWNFAHDFDPRTLDDFVAATGPTKDRHKLHISDVECLRPGQAKGVLVGGNLSLLQTLIGTPYDWSANGAILLIEDVDEPLFRIDRMLAQLRLAGKFEGVRAVLIGDMVDIRDGETPYGHDLKQLFLEYVPPYIPLAMRFPCGHGRYITTLPIGASASLKLDMQGAELIFG